MSFKQRLVTLSYIILAEQKELWRRSGFWGVVGLVMALIGLDFIYILNFTRDPQSMPMIFQDIALAILLLSPYLILNQIKRYLNDHRMLQLTPNLSEGYWWWIGQYIAALCIGIYILIPTLVFPLILTALGNPDWGVIVSGYLGILILHSILTAILFILMGLLRSVVLIYWGIYTMIGFLWIYPESQTLIGQKIGVAITPVSAYEMVLPFFYGAIDIHTLLKLALWTLVSLLISTPLSRRFGLIRHVFY